MADTLSLLEQIQGLIERTYGLDPGIDDVGAFLVGDRGRLRFCSGPAAGERGAAMLLVRMMGGGAARALIYYPDALVRHLERHHPLREIHAGNVDALLSLVEELDHLLLLADRLRRGGDTSLLEMELHANVTKALVLRQLLRRHLGRPLLAREKIWVRWHALEKGRYADPDPAVRARYREARRLARKALDHLETMNAADRLGWLRWFARTPGPRRIREVERLAA